MKNSKLAFQMMKSQIFWLGILGGVLVVLQLFLFFFKFNDHPENSQISALATDKSITSVSGWIPKNFNPNNLDASQWQAMGFSPKQAAAIIKYKAFLGGNFSSKEDIKKCFVISEDKYNEIKAFILLPEQATQKSITGRSFETQSKTLNIHQKFNPDRLTLSDWQVMGFSEKQAQSILKYKAILGGSFRSKDLLAKCFVISDQAFAQMSPYILLPEKVNMPESQPIVIERRIKVNEYFDPNSLDLEGWQAIGFSEKQAQTILNYKNKILKGAFHSVEDVQKCFVISPEKFDEMKAWMKITTSNTPSNEKKTNTTEVKTNKITTDFSKLNLNEINTEELKNFGFSDRTAKVIVDYRNSLGGFVEKNQIFETYNIDREKAEELVGLIQLDSRSVKKYSLKDAPESWLKSHPYFRYAADKIIYFRLSNDNEKKIWKLMNLKPEQELKMKKYLK